MSARIDHGGLLAALARLGCKVQSGHGAERRGRCLFPETVIRRVVEHVGGSAADKVEIVSGWNPQRRLHMGGSYPHILEWPSGGSSQRLPTSRVVVDKLSRVC